MNRFLLQAGRPRGPQAEPIKAPGREREPFITKMAESGLPFKVAENGGARDGSFEAFGEQG
jgi:hypothetical protein